MLSFIAENFGTILVAVIIAALVILIIRKMSKDRKKGKTSCGCGCSNCPSAGVCHSKK